MSNQVLSQSATNLTVHGQCEANFDFDASANRAAERKTKGLTVSAFALKRNTLISVCCQDYRAHFASVYGKSERLPSDVFEKIEHAIDKLIGKKLAEIHTGNVVSVRRTFQHKPNDYKFVHRIVATGEDEISLEEQHFAANLALNAAERRLNDLMDKKTPDLDREKEVKAQLMKITLTRDFIAGEIKRQQAVTT